MAGQVPGSHRFQVGSMSGASTGEKSDLGHVAASVEALWTVEFRAFGAWVGGGIVAVERRRLVGGDNNYYYLGTYDVVHNAIKASVNVVHLNRRNSDAAKATEKRFGVRVVGERHGNQILGIVYKSDAPSVQIPFRLIRQADLP